MEPSIWIAVASCLLGCYVAACNIALKTFSRSRLGDLLEERGQAHRLQPFLDRLSHHLLVTGTLRTGLSLATLLATLYYVETRFPGLTQPQQYLCAFIVALFLLSIFIVGIPVSWARHDRERLIAASLPLLSATSPILGLLTAPLHIFDPVVRRISGADSVDDDPSELSDEVLTIVEDHQRGTEVDEAQKEMLEAVFELPSTTAAEIMTPRTDIKAIEAGATLQEVKAAILRMGHSRIPVYEESLDRIAGVLYAKDLIPFVGDGRDFNLRKVLREPIFAPESKSVRELLADFKQRKVHLALVLDEYGGTSGLITIEDILEEIVGEIQDEYEPLEEPEQISILNEHTADADARIHVDDLNDAFDVELPEDEDYDTLGGFVSATFGQIPEPGDAFEFQNLRFTVTDAERTKVKRVRIEKLDPQPAEPAAQPNP